MGEYVGSADIDENYDDFTHKMAELYADFTDLSTKAVDLTAKVDAVMQGLLE